MENKKLKIIYEDNDLLVIDKPAGMIVFPEGAGIPPGRGEEKTLIDLLLEKYPELKNVGKTPRYGIIHRLDKDTSGILLVAKNNKSLIFSQKQFKDRRVEKRYIALVIGNIKGKQGIIKTLIGRAPKNRKKQKAYLFNEPNAKGKREAITEYKVITRLRQCYGGQERYYTLVEVFPKTGRKHQIRCHLFYLGHPIAGDKIYAFKNQLFPEGLNRQFLHASYIKVKLVSGETKEFKSALPEDLEKILKKLK